MNVISSALRHGARGDHDAKARQREQRKADVQHQIRIASPARRSGHSTILPIVMNTTSGVITRPGVFRRHAETALEQQRRVEQQRKHREAAKHRQREQRGETACCGTCRPAEWRSRAALFPLPQRVPDSRRSTASSAQRLERTGRASAAFRRTTAASRAQPRSAPRPASRAASCLHASTCRRCGRKRQTKNSDNRPTGRFT